MSTHGIVYWVLIVFVALLLIGAYISIRRHIINNMTEIAHPPLKYQPLDTLLASLQKYHGIDVAALQAKIAELELKDEIDPHNFVRDAKSVILPNDIQERFDTATRLDEKFAAINARLDNLAGQGLSYDDEGRLNVGGTSGRITVSDENVDIDPSYQGQQSITVTGTPGFSALKKMSDETSARIAAMLPQERAEASLPKKDEGDEDERS